MYIPSTRSELIGEQERLARLSPEPWRPPDEALLIGGCFVAFERGIVGAGAGGDCCWAAATTLDRGRVVGSVVVAGQAGSPYEAGMLFLRVGRVLLAAIDELSPRPNVLLVNGTGLDHPRRAGLSLHLGALIDVPTVGVTHRPLLAADPWPGERRGDRSPLRLDDQVVGYWLRTRTGTRPLAIHAAWRTDANVAAEIVLLATRRVRTPGPLRIARNLAREARDAHLA